jgi:hypothetical protein
VSNGRFGLVSAGYGVGMTFGLIALAVVALVGFAAVILFVWRIDARRNEDVAHDPERVEQQPTREQPTRDQHRG